jgi:hypothetical protein
MRFAEPRPHRRPFHAHGEHQLTIVPTRNNMNLAVTSFTVANQDSRSHFARLVSTDGSTKEQLLEVLVAAETTKHFPFPHPLMVGVGRSLLAEDEVSSGSISPMTVVGYEWLAADEPQNLPTSSRRRSAKRR